MRLSHTPVVCKLKFIFNKKVSANANFWFLDCGTEN